MSTGMQFITSDYSDFKMLVGRFKPEVMDVYYRDVPYSGLGQSAATFNAWAIDYERRIFVTLALSQNGVSGTPLDIKPASFAADFPQATAFGNANSLVQPF